MRVFIPSKDRVCQLDLLLRSMQENLPNINFNITILYTYSNEDYKNGYFKLMESDEYSVLSRKGFLSTI